MSGVDAAIERGEGCMLCNTLLRVRPTLQLRFTTCCGASCCSDCIATRSRATKTWKCPRCTVFVSAKDHSTDTYDVQKYTREAAVRESVNKIFNSRRCDFGPDDDPDALTRYNDYLEQAQDFVFDLVWGDAATVARATQRLRVYEQTHDAEIKRNYARAAEDLRKLNAAKHAAANPTATATASAAVGMSDDKPAALTAAAAAAAAAAPAPPPMFVGPQPKQKPKTEAKDGAVKPEPLTPQQRLQAAYTAQLKKQSQKLAGGYLPAYDQRRCDQEMRDSLMF